MILRALYDFLTSDDVLNDELRQGGRERLRELIASEVYHGRRPRGAGPVCLTLSRTGGIVHSGVARPVPIKSPVIDVHIWAKDIEASSSELVERVYVALQDLMIQFHGNLNDDTTVQLISQEGEPFESNVTPDDGLDNWTRHYIVPYLIGLQWVVPTGAN